MASVSWLCCLCLVVMVMSSTVSPGAARSTRPPGKAAKAKVKADKGPLDVSAWVDMLKANIGFLQAEYERAEKNAKRSCNGFPCMYTHLGSKAGKAARMHNLISIIHNCVQDPNCSPGKRRRRSAQNPFQEVISSLTKVQS